MKQTKNLKEKEEHQSLVWIEIIRTESAEENHEKAKKFNALLKRLGIEYCEISYSERAGRFLHTNKACGSFLTLEDDGHFFNLDFIASQGE